jgi:hypothetical protein
MSPFMSSNNASFAPVRFPSRESRESAVILDVSSQESYSCGIVPSRLFREWFVSMGIDMRSENSAGAVAHGVSAEIDGEKGLRPRE